MLKSEYELAKDKGIIFIEFNPTDKPIEYVRVFPSTDQDFASLEKLKDH